MRALTGNSEKYLVRALKKLQEEGLIKKNDISHKYKPYSLVGASESLISLIALTPLFDFAYNEDGKKALTVFTDQVLIDIARAYTS